MVDGWKNKVTNKKLMVFTLRNLNCTQTFLHAEDVSTEEENGKYLSGLIDTIITKAKNEYDTNIFAVVSDNAANIKRAARRARGESAEDLLTTTCLSHSGNRIFEQIRAMDKEFFNHVNDVIKVFKEPDMTKRLADLGGYRIQTYPDTRFCYIRESIASIVNNVQFLRNIMATDGVIIREDIKRKLMDGSNFLNKCNSYLEIFAPICQFVNACQSPQANIVDGVEYLFNLTTSLNAISPIYDPIINGRINKAVPDVGFAAHLLHHRYRGSRLNQNQKDKGIDFIENNLGQEGLEEYE